MVSIISVTDLWASSGIFDIALPLVLFFAIIFSILNRSQILGKNKAIDAVVSFVLSMFIIINPLTAPFLAAIFSKTGIALIILLAFLIIIGLFIERDQDSKKMFKGFGIVAGILFLIWLIILVNDFYAIYTWFPIAYFGLSWSQIIFWLFIIAVIVVIAVSSGDKDKNKGNP